MEKTLLVTVYSYQFLSWWLLHSTFHTGQLLVIK